MKGINRNERREARLVKRLATIQEIAECKGIARKRRRQTEASRAKKDTYYFLTRIACQTSRFM